MKWNCHSGCARSSGVVDSRPTRSCSAARSLWPRRRFRACGTTWFARSKRSSVTQRAPIVSSTTFWRKRSYLSSLSPTRSRSAASVIAGCSSHTPTIIIRLTSLSIRSQAVSTRDMRSSVGASIGLSPRVISSRAKMLANMRGRQWRFSPTEEHDMADLKARFEQAVAESKSLPEKPDNMTLLKIYALYKQATSGDAEGKRPGFGDMVGRAKWDAWNELKGKSGDEAMQEYVDLVESLK